MPTHESLGPDDRDSLEDRWKPLAFVHRAVPLVRVEVRSLASRALGFRAPTARKDSAYRSGRSPDDWLKNKDPDASAATREAEEDWS
jgi:hypothetical protein